MKLKVEEEEGEGGVTEEKVEKWQFDENQSKSDTISMRITSSER